jgi:hypothetical protein
VNVVSISICQQKNVSQKNKRSGKVNFKLEKIRLPNAFLVILLTSVTLLIRIYYCRIKSIFHPHTILPLTFLNRKWPELAVRRTRRDYERNYWWKWVKSWSGYWGHYTHAVLTIPTRTAQLNLYALFHGAESIFRSYSHSAGQEISPNLWTPKVHYCVHESAPLVPILSQINLVHTLTSRFSKNFPSTPSS